MTVSGNPHEKDNNHMLVNEALWPPEKFQESNGPLSWRNTKYPLPQSLLTFISQTRKRSDYWRAVFVIAGCTIVAQAMEPFFDLSNVVMVYILGVVVVATSYGIGPSILVSILSVASFDFFFVPPLHTFVVEDTQYLVTLIVMLTIAGVVSTLTEQVRRQLENSRQKERNTAALYSMSKELASSMDFEELMSIGMRHISEIFESEVGIIRDRSLSTSMEFNPKNGTVYLPFFVDDEKNSFLEIRPSDASRFRSPEQKYLLETFVSQVALACERARLWQEAETSRLSIRSEQLKNSLLSSVSHDLRTPLSTIIGAASGIADNDSDLGLAECKLLAGEIYNESVRLNKLVGNLLDMTRVESKAMRPKKEWHPVDEIIGSAITLMDSRDREITTHVSDSSLMIWVDAVLIQQVLVNILENAFKYAPGSPYEIEIEKRECEVFIGVSDRGPGVSIENRKLIFEKFYREKPGTGSGVGLGLAICAGIIEAHGGKIWVEDRVGGGAYFCITLPLSPVDADTIQPEFYLSSRDLDSD